MEVLKSKYLLSGVVIQGLYRNDELEYPEAALREAIINAIAHRDYTGGYTQIKIYPEKLVIWNNGELPVGLPIDLLKKDHPSKPRNKHIANVLHTYGLIEGWGHGTTKMVTECVNAGLSEPLFEEYAGGFQVTFNKDIYTTEFLQAAGLSERQMLAIGFLKANGSINNQIYQSLTGAIKRTATRDLNELVTKRIVEKTGITGKGTSYNLIGRKPENLVKSTNSSDGLDTLTDLDRRLELLDKKLQVFDPEDEIRDQFNKEVLTKILNTWWADLIREVVPIIQRFNKYFVDPEHWTHLPQPLGGTRFKDEPADEVVKNIFTQFENQIKQMQDHYLRYDNTQATIQTAYGTFRKAGIDTFGCNYAIEAKFSQNWYEIFSDDEVMKRNRKLLFRRQYHKPVTHEEVRLIAKNFGNLIYSHIESSIENIQKGKGDIKETKGTKVSRDKTTSRRNKKNTSILGKWQLQDSSQYALDFTNYGILKWTHKPYRNSDLKYAQQGSILTVSGTSGTAVISPNGTTLTISGFSDPGTRGASGSKGPDINGIYVRQSR